MGTWVRSLSARGVGVLFVGIAACRTPAPTPDAAVSASRAVGLEGALVDREGDLPLDEPRASEENPAAETRTTDELVRRALAVHAGLQASLEDVRVALSDARRARQWRNPLLDASVRWPFDRGVGVLEAGLAWDLASAVGRDRDAGAADERLFARVARTVALALDVAVEARELAARRSADARRAEHNLEQRRLLERWTELVESRLAAGEGTRLDVTSLRARLAELELEALDVSARELESRLELALLVGEPSSNVTWRIAPSVGTRAPLPDEPTCVRIVRERDPELAALRHEARALEIEARAVGALGREGTGVGVVAEHEHETSFGPAVAVPLPIFDDGSARRSALAAAAEAARHRALERERAVVAGVRLARERVLAARAAVDRARDGWRAALGAQRDLAESVYRAGQADVTTLLFAAHELQRADARLVELEERHEIALARFERALGGRAALASSVDASASGSERATENESTPKNEDV